MGELLHGRYGGDAVALADDMGHAAWCTGIMSLGGRFAKDVESGTEAKYAGGTLENIEQLHALPGPDWEGQVEAMRPQRERFAEAGLATWVMIEWSFDRLSAWMGLENFAMALYDDRDFVEQATRWLERRNREGVERVIAELRPDFVLYNGDCAYKTGPMIDPGMIREVWADPTRATIDAVRALDIPFAFHTDGKLDEVLPLLHDWGIAAVHGCEKQANDLGHLVETFGDDIALCGNMDVVFLHEATPEQVERETIEMIEVGSAKQRFIAACNTSPQDYIPDENYAAFCRTIANDGR